MLQESSAIRQPIIIELEYMRTMGSKIFVFPFIGQGKIQNFGYFMVKTLGTCTAIQLLLTLCITGFEDWLKIINIAPCLGVCVISLIKYTNIHTHGELFNHIFYHFHDQLWDIVSSNSNSHMRVLKRYGFITKAINRFIVYYSIPLILVFASFPFLVMMYENKVLGKTLHYLYPYDGWYPFDKVKWYWLVYTWESYMTAVVVCVYGFSNMMYLTYIVLICMELKILGHTLEEILGKEDVKMLKNGQKLKEINERVLRQLKMVIERYHSLARISASLDNVLGDAMLLNYFLGAVFICLTAYTFTVVEDFYESARYFSFFFSLLVETFYQCIIGQILCDHSENLADSVYSADWPNATPQVKKILLMFMTRTQKPFILTAKGYINMNLNTFSAICSMSYQFFNLLRTVYP